MKSKNARKGGLSCKTSSALNNTAATYYFPRVLQWIKCIRFQANDRHRHCAAEPSHSAVTFAVRLLKLVVQKCSFSVLMSYILPSHRKKEVTSPNGRMLFSFFTAELSHWIINNLVRYWWFCPNLIGCPRLYNDLRKPSSSSHVSDSEAYGCCGSSFASHFRFALRFLGGSIVDVVRSFSCFKDPPTGFNICTIPKTFGSNASYWANFQ